MASREGFFEFVAGLVVGISTGATLALLFAPRPGHEVREQIAGTTEAVAGRARETAEKLAGSTEAVAGRARETAEKLAVEGRAAVEGVASQVRETTDRIAAGRGSGAEE